MKVCFVTLVSMLSIAAGPLKWHSAATGKELSCEVREPSSADRALPTVVYLKNLSIPRIGRDSDESIIDDLLKSGDLVLVVDYAHDPKATSPDLNADILKLRQDIADTKQKTLLTDHHIDVNHLFILCEGFRLKRDVEFARDGSRVLGMDICYPANPKKPVPILMEITCDNANRMGSFSMLFCHDSILEGAQAAGFATAMVDHPVPPPYKGIDDPMKESVARMDAAVDVLRRFSPDAKIGAIGFSRGAPFAAILAGQHKVDAALVHGNRFDYLDLLPNDPMIPRFEKAWGKPNENRDRWAEHGASMYVTKDSAPMFLNTSNAESAEYQNGLARFDELLTAKGVDHVYQVDQDGRGHRMTTNPKTLAKIYRFFHAHLDVGSVDSKRYFPAATSTVLPNGT